MTSAHPHQDFSSPYTPAYFYEGYVPGGTLVSANILFIFIAAISTRITQIIIFFTPYNSTPLTFLCSTRQFDLVGDAAVYTQTGTVRAQMGEPEEQFMATSRDAHLQDVNVQH
jgi:hypothetical protein